MMACIKCGSQNLRVSGTTSTENGGLTYWYLCNDCGEEFRDNQVFMNIKKMKKGIDGQTNI